MAQTEAARPKVYVRRWIWRDADRKVTPGVAIFRGNDLQAHLTPAQARNLADKLHDMADTVEAKHEKESH